MPQIELTDDALSAFFIEHAPAIVARLNQAIEVFFKAEDRPVVHFSVSEPMIQIDGMTIEICPGVHEQVSIGGRRRFPAFDIITYKHHPATHLEPDDVESIHLGSARNPWKAAEVALTEWFKIASSVWFETASLED